VLNQAYIYKLEVATVCSYFSRILREMQMS